MKSVYLMITSVLLFTLNGYGQAQLEQQFHDFPGTVTRNGSQTIADPAVILLPKFNNSLGRLDEVVCTMSLDGNINSDFRTLENFPVQATIRPFSNGSFRFAEDNLTFCQLDSLGQSPVPPAVINIPVGGIVPVSFLTESFKEVILGAEFFLERFRSDEPQIMLVDVLPGAGANLFIADRVPSGSRVTEVNSSRSESFTYNLRVTYLYEPGLDLKFQTDSLKLTQMGLDVPKVEGKDPFNIRLNFPLFVEAIIEAAGSDVSSDSRSTVVQIEIGEDKFLSEPIQISSLTEPQVIRIEIPTNADGLLPITSADLKMHPFDLNLVIDPEGTISDEGNIGNNSLQLEVDEEFEIEGVPIHSQFEEEWKDKPYTTEDLLVGEKFEINGEEVTVQTFKEVSISKAGCGLVSASMVFQTYDPDLSLEPDDLNQLMGMHSPRPFSDAGDIHFDDFPDILRPLGLVVSWKRWISKDNSIPEPRRSEKMLEEVEAELRNNNPIVLRVKSRSNGDGHFVTAVGIARDGNGVRTLIIHDPGVGAVERVKRFLTNPDDKDKFTNARLMRKGSDPSSLRVSLVGGEILLVDPEGRRFGIDPISGELIEEIPGDAHYESIAINNLNPNDTDELISTRTIHIPNHQPGDYQILVHSPDGGETQLEIANYDVNDALIYSEIVSPEIPDEGVLEFEATFFNEPQSNVAGDLRPKKASVLLFKKRDKKDHLLIEGKLVAGDGSNGFSAETEGFQVILNNDQFSKFFPADLFVKKGRVSKLKERGPPKYKLRINENGRFKLIVKRADLDFVNFMEPVKVEIKIGDDIFTEEIQFRHNLKKRKWWSIKKIVRKIKKIKNKGAFFRGK